MQQPQGGDWKEERHNSKRSNNLNAIGCVGVLFLGASLLGVLGQALGFYHDAAIAPFARPLPLLGLAAAVAVSVALMILPGRKQELEGRRRYQEMREAKRSEASEWDRQLDETEAYNTGVREAAARKKRRLWLGALVAVLVFPTLLRAAGNTGQALGFDGEWASLLVYGAAALLFVWFMSRMRGLNQQAAERRQVTPEQYKEQLVLPILRETMPDAAFHPPGGFDAGPVLEGRALGAVDVCRSNDFLTGTYRGVHLASADLVVETLQKRRLDGGKGPGVVDETRFTGRWLMLQGKKTLTSGFYLWSKGFAGGKGQKVAMGRGMQAVPLENAHFNEIFDVYAFTGHDVFLFLTPALMEYLEGLMRTDAGGAANHEVALVCVGNTVQVYIEGVPDAFEPEGGTRLLTEAASRKKILSELSVITDTVDSLYGNLV